MAIGDLNVEGAQALAADMVDMYAGKPLTEHIATDDHRRIDIGTAARRQRIDRRLHRVALGRRTHIADHLGIAVKTDHGDLVPRPEQFHGRLRRLPRQFNRSCKTIRPRSYHHGIVFRFLWGIRKFQFCH